MLGSTMSGFQGFSGSVTQVKRLCAALFATMEFVRFTAGPGSCRIGCVSKSTTESMFDLCRLRGGKSRMLSWHQWRHQHQCHKSWVIRIKCVHFTKSTVMYVAFEKFRTELSNTPTARTFISITITPFVSCLILQRPPTCVRLNLGYSVS